jgi:hypothetical protein
MPCRRLVENSYYRFISSRGAPSALGTTQKQSGARSPHSKRGRTGAHFGVRWPDSALRRRRRTPAAEFRARTRPQRSWAQQQEPVHHQSPPQGRQGSALLGPGPYALGPAPRKPSALSPALQGPALLDLRLLQPTRDPRQLLELIQQRLEHSALPGRILSLRLSVPNLPPHRALQHDLFDPHAQSQHEWPRLLERLRARLGDQCLLQPQALPDHRPEHAAKHRPLVSMTTVDTSQRPRKNTAPATPAHSLNTDLSCGPLWLLPNPIPLDSIEASHLLPDQTERIEGGWWASKDIRRDYYCATDTHGGYCWIYQDLRAPQRRYLQGWFG